MHLTLEDHISEICPLCKKVHSQEWEDQWDMHVHYRSLVCDCGYEIFIRSKILTSGITRK